jgi:Tfp pilus assembly protein PilF
LLVRLQAPGAWLAAALFALHPIMVESVAWLTERKNVLSGVFFLAALLAWLRFQRRERHGGLWYAAALLLFAGALLAKTSTVVLPVAALLIVWVEQGRIAWRKDVLPLLPFFLLAVAAGLLTVWMEHHRVGAEGPPWEHTLAERVLISGRAVAFYSGKLLWPAPILAVYPKWNIDSRDILQWLYPVSVLAVLVLLWALRNRVDRRPVAAVLFFVAALFPVLGFFNVYGMTFSYLADRWAYLPALGFCALVAGGLTWVAQQWRFPWLVPVVGSVLSMMCAVLTWRSSARFANEESLWRTTIADNPGSWMPHYGLAVVLARQGHNDEAIHCYEEAIQLKPDDADARNNLANLLLAQDKPDEAIAHLRAALVVSPRYAAVQNTLGLALLNKGEKAEAMAHYEQAVEIKPDYFEAWNNLANAHLQDRQPGEAIPFYEKALRIKPDSPDVISNYGAALAQLGRLDEAEAQFRKALELRPGDHSALNNLKYVLRRQGRTEELKRLNETPEAPK